MRRADFEALDVLASLPPATLTAMIAVLPRATRLDLRDAAVRQCAARFYGDAPPTPSSERMAADLARHAREGAPSGSALRAALSQILALDRGIPISARHISCIRNGIRQH